MSDTIITAGVSLVVSAFPGIKEIVTSIIASLFKVAVSVEDDYVAIACGFLLIILGLFLRKDIKDRIFVLNMFGLFSQKEISDVQNINDLKLVDFKVKEVIIDFVDIFRNGPMTEEKNQLIVDKVKRQCEAFSNRSKDFKSCFTGMAPIPYTILAGTRLSDCNLKRFFEFKRTDNKYYELKAKDGFQKHEPLHVTYPQYIKQDSTDVIVALSITRTVQEPDLVQFGDLNLIKIRLDEPKDNVIVSNEQLEDYGNIVLNAIEAIKEKYPKINRVHFVASIPSCVSIKLGMLFALSNNRLPQIISYHFVQSNLPKYPFGIIVSITADDCGKLVEVEGGEV
ncbi:MAG: SAVED domain-containing protein [Desulfitobacterium hafniense]|nr:SAVED domain-containing protein [Desulfitobacterium hafniense]